MLKSVLFVFLLTIFCLHHAVATAFTNTDAASAELFCITSGGRVPSPFKDTAQPDGIVERPMVDRSDTPVFGMSPDEALEALGSEPDSISANPLYRATGIRKSSTEDDLVALTLAEWGDSSPDHTQAGPSEGIHKPFGVSPGKTAEVVVEIRGRFHIVTTVPPCISREELGSCRNSKGWIQPRCLAEFVWALRDILDRAYHYAPYYLGKSMLLHNVIADEDKLMRLHSQINRVLETISPPAEMIIIYCPMYSDTIEYRQTQINPEVTLPMNYLQLASDSTQLEWRQFTDQFYAILEDGFFFTRIRPGFRHLLGETFPISK